MVGLREHRWYFRHVSKPPITVRLMKHEDAKAFVETLRYSVREVAAADYPPEVIEDR